MWLTKLFTTAMVAWLGLLPSSCTKSKTPPSRRAPGAGSVCVCAANENLGDLSVTNRCETCVNLGAGKSCTIRPNLIGRGDLQITMALESKNTGGKTRDLSVVQVVAKAGKPLEVA